MRLLIIHLLAAALVFAGPARADTISTNAPTLRKTAIIVENRTGEEFNDDIAVLEGLVGNRNAGGDFSVLSREVDDNTSALRLAQNLGADFILIPSIMTFGHEKNAYKRQGK